MTSVGFKHSTFVTAIVVIVSKPLFLLFKMASLYNANFANGLNSNLFVSQFHMRTLLISRNDHCFMLG